MPYKEHKHTQMQGSFTSQTISFLYKAKPQYFSRLSTLLKKSNDRTIIKEKRKDLETDQTRGELGLLNLMITIFQLKHPTNTKY